ncbi:MAG TPA: type II toxin-antitoxin system VapC family toxin [Sphingomonas sp.]|nr:type II toxin-antitoxin system VapC family toxin [Sphingomonas sp.]
MIAADTNLLVRLITRDDPRLAERSESVLASGAYISPTVLLETAWVLAYSYSIGRAALAEALEGVLDMPSIQVADESAIRWALSRYRDGADIADMVHLTQAGRAEVFVTFDRGVARQAGPDAPLRIETLR